MIYDEICKTINNYLGEKYRIDYANNHDIDWSKILPSVMDEMTYGVLRVDSATTQQVGSDTVRTEQLRLIVAIPENRAIFNEVCVNISSMLQGLNNQLVYSDEATALLLFGEQTDAEGTIINGKRWWIKNIIFSANFFEDIIVSNDASVTIDSISVKGIISTNYLREIAVDGLVYNGQTAQKNYSNSYKQVLTIEAVFVKSDTLISTLITNETNIAKTYTVVYNNGIVSRTINAILSTLNENIITGNVLRATLVFLGGA